MQLVLQLASVFAAGIMACFIYLLGTAFKYAGIGMMPDLCVLLERTPAMDAFLLFAVQTLSIITAVCTFKAVSNHSILSLDILYVFSLLMLILFHMLKEAANPLVKSV